MRVRTAVSATAALGLTLAGLLATSAPARAGVDDTDNGYSASVSIHFYGSGVKGGSTTKSVIVHPSCWWEAAAGDYTNAAAMLKWYDEVTGGLQTYGILTQYGPREVWKDAADLEAAGGDVSWYRVYCKDPADYTRYGAGGVVDGVDPPIFGGPANAVTYLYHAYNAGQEPPAPLVPPAELARAAYDEMTIPEPISDYNPKIANSPGEPTLVGLPTWFWVTEPLALGEPGAAANTGELEVTAEIFPPFGRVFATVTAVTKQLEINSKYGDGVCDRDKALVKYAGDSSDAATEGACTVIFKHAAKALAVTTHTHWTATWVGSGGTGGDMDPKDQQAAFDVAVAEVQNIVTR